MLEPLKYTIAMVVTAQSGTLLAASFELHTVDFENRINRNINIKF